MSHKVTGSHHTIINNVIIGLKLEYTSASGAIKVMEARKRYITAPLSQHEEKIHINNHSDNNDCGFSSSQSQVQVQQNLLSDHDLQVREKQILHVAKTVTEVHSIMGEMNMMVIDQGTILDTLEYNITQTAVKVESGTKELSKADVHQKKASLTSNKILIGLAAAVIALSVGLGIKKH